MDYMINMRTPPQTHLLQIQHQGQFFRPIVHYIELERKFKKSTWCKLREHTHDVYHVVLYLTGENQFSLCNQLRNFCRGTLVLTSPGESHYFGATTQSDLSYQEFMLTLEREDGTPLNVSFRRLLEMYVGSELPEVPFPVQLNSAQIQMHTQLVVELLNTLKSPSASSSISQSFSLLRLFQFFIEEIFFQRKTPPTIPPGLLLARERIDHHFHHKNPLDELAKIAGLSAGHFCRSFKSHFGLSPIQYLVQTRLRTAKTLLKTTTLSCKEISDRCGFYDPVFFNRIFKRSEKISPNSYRHS